MEIEEYDFLQNDDGQLMLVFDGFEKAPENPFLTLNGDGVVLKRSVAMPELKMGNVSADVWNLLETAKNVLICEIGDDGEPLQVYDAPVKKSLNA